MIKIDQFVFQFLKTEYIQQAISLLIEQFQKNQPEQSTLAKYHPQTILPFQTRYELWKSWITISIQNKLVFGIFDTNNNNQLVGINISRDINFQLETILQNYTIGLSQQRCFLQLQQRIKQNTPQDIKEILQEVRNVLDVMIIGISSSCWGRRLSVPLIRMTEIAAKEQGYKYVYCLASNLKTSKSLQRSGFAKINEIDLRKIEIEGVKPFEFIQQQNCLTSNWIKKVQ